MQLFFLFFAFFSFAHTGKDIGQRTKKKKGAAFFSRRHLATGPSMPSGPSTWQLPKKKRESCTTEAPGCNIDMKLLLALSGPYPLDTALCKNFSRGHLAHWLIWALGTQCNMKPILAPSVPYLLSTPLCKFFSRGHLAH